MKDVYEDLAILEEYVSLNHASRGIALVMNDLSRFVTPKKKDGKCWAYDISHGHVFPGGQISVPIGGKNVSVELKKSYAFSWEKFGDIWFAEIEGAKRLTRPSCQTLGNSLKRSFMTTKKAAVPIVKRLPRNLRKEKRKICCYKKSCCEASRKNGDERKTSKGESHHNESSGMETKPWRKDTR